MDYKIISKFIKDISFEIPNAESFVMLEKEITKYALNFDIKSNSYKKNIIQVDTTIKMSPAEDVKHKILAEITCASLVSIENNFDNKKELEKVVLIKVPTDVYPTLYETFIYLFEKAGIKNMQITKKADFEKLYKEKNK
jgi:preprotein translocase subunit SecB